MNISGNGVTIFSGFSEDGYGYVIGFSDDEKDKIVKEVAPGNFRISLEGFCDTITEKEEYVEGELVEIPLRPVAIFYDPPATSVFWNDGTSTKVCTHNEPFVKEFGYAMALARKVYGGNRSEFLRDVESGYSHTEDIQ